MGQPGAEEATEANRALVEGKKVRLEYDVQKQDKYGRTLAYVYLEDGTFVNAELVKQGYAQVATYPPNVKYVDLFQKYQQEAQKEKRGLWGNKTAQEITKPTKPPSNYGGGDPCVWVNAYVRKDGTKVKGHWRSKPGRICPKANR